MDYTAEEIIDRMSIVCLKVSEIDSPSLKEEYAKYEEALESLKVSGLALDQNSIDEIFRLNKEQWNIMEQINKIKKESSDLKEIGRLFIKAEKLNKKRNFVKNKIVKETGRGFKEIEMN